MQADNPILETVSQHMKKIIQKDQYAQLCFQGFSFRYEEASG